MPELPEVERGRRLAESVAAGRRIAAVACAPDPIVYAGAPPAEWAELRGRRVLAARRWGKQLWFDLDAPPHPLFHFGMSGGFRVPGDTPLKLATGPVHRPDEWPPRYWKVRFTFDDGGELVMTDARRLGRLLLRAAPREEPPVSRLGFDPLLALAGRVRAALAGTGIEWELILADDDSGDGSEAVVAELARTLPIRIETRRDPPRDLSRSVLFGIGRARFDRLVVMDADLSHPPERIADLLHALDGDCDMVVGSRYTPAGVVDRAWSPWRFLVSRVATALARPLTSCSDPMAGFFAIDRRALPEPDTLRPVGYKIALELMVRGRFRVREVPIEFHDRNLGSSKMSWRQQLDFLRHLYRLYAFRHGGPVRLLCFGFVGATGFVIDVGCYLGLQWAGVEHRLARLLSFLPAVTWNWLLNRRLTFAERPREPRMRQWTKFVASSLVGLTANVGSYAVLTSLVGFFDRYRLLALVAGVGLGGIINFLLATLFVYRRHRAPGPGPAPEAAAPRTGRKS